MTPGPPFYGKVPIGPKIDVVLPLPIGPKIDVVLPLPIGPKIDDVLPLPIGPKIDDVPPIPVGPKVDVGLPNGIDGPNMPGASGCTSGENKVPVIGKGVLEGIMGPGKNVPVVGNGCNGVGAGVGGDKGDVGVNGDVGGNNGFMFGKGCVGAEGVGIANP